MQSATTSSVKQPLEFKGLAQISGHAGLDFLNTIKYRGKSDPRDRLANFTDVISWAQLSGIITDKEARVLLEQAKGCEKTYREICVFREYSRILFQTASAQNTEYLKAAKYVENVIAALRPTPVIDVETGTLTQYIKVKTPRDLKARIVWEFADLLFERPDLSIKTCGGNDCDWVFIDRTKAKRRKWCDTRTCGNTARVRRHRLKQ